MEATRQHSAAPGENHLYIKPSKRMLSSETNVNRDDADWSDRSFGDDKYADLTVKCASREWKVHRVVVCRQCDFFASCCNGQFKVSMEGRSPRRREELMFFSRNRKNVPLTSKMTTRTPYTPCSSTSTPVNSTRTSPLQAPR